MNTIPRITARKLWLGLGGLVVVALLALGAVYAVASRGEDANLAMEAPGLPEASPAARGSAIPSPAIGAATATPGVIATAPVALSPVGVTEQQFVIDPSQSSAKFVIQKTVLATTSSAVATGSGVQGVFYASPDGLGTATPSSFNFDLRTLETSDLLLNRFLDSGAIDTARYPRAEFVAKGTTPFTAGYGLGTQFSFTLSGTLTLNGVSRDVTWQVLARQSGQFFSATGDLDVRMSDFNVTVPNLPIGRAADVVRVQVLFVAVA